MTRCAAVCDSCRQPSARLWVVETSNATGGWGSDHADPRCLGRKAGWVSEIASLAREHVDKHGSTFTADYTREPYDTQVQTYAARQICAVQARLRLRVPWFP